MSAVGYTGGGDHGGGRDSEEEERSADAYPGLATPHKEADDPLSPANDSSIYPAVAICLGMAGPGLAQVPSPFQDGGKAVASAVTVTVTVAVAEPLAGKEAPPGPDPNPSPALSPAAASVASQARRRRRRIELEVSSASRAGAGEEGHPALPLARPGVGPDATADRSASTDEREGGPDKADCPLPPANASSIYPAVAHCLGMAGSEAELVSSSLDRRGAVAVATPLAGKEGSHCLDPNPTAAASGCGGGAVVAPLARKEEPTNLNPYPYPNPNPNPNPALALAPAAAATAATALVVSEARRNRRRIELEVKYAARRCPRTEDSEPQSEDEREERWLALPLTRPGISSGTPDTTIDCCEYSDESEDGDIGADKTLTDTVAEVGKIKGGPNGGTASLNPQSAEGGASFIFILKETKIRALLALCLIAVVGLSSSVGIRGAGAPTPAPTAPPTAEAVVWDLAPPLVDDNIFSEVVTFVPGELTVFENGLALSAGLSSRIIAESGSRVNIEGGESEDRFHYEPDAAACVPNPDGDGWIYVSNSEEGDEDGGVGSIVFDAVGNVVDYKRVLSGTSRNCGGGLTPWNTWISCEENDEDGQIYEVDPAGKRSKRTVLGQSWGGNYESFAYDVRDPSRPRFFYTEDKSDGALRRFTPHPKAVKRFKGDEAFNLLHSEDGTFEYLVFDNVSRGRGTFRWSTSLSDGRSSASKYFTNSEGITCHRDRLVFVSKKQKETFVLNLDDGNFTSSGTERGIFDGEPDQVNYMLKRRSGARRRNGGSPLLVFTEEGGRRNGVHARNEEGNYLTLVEARDKDMDETTGLTFSPDLKHMYFAFQDDGYVFDVWRDDGLEFDGDVLDIKWHYSSEESGD